MLSKQATITLTSTDPHGAAIMLDDLLQFVAAVQSLGKVATIELHEGELIAVGEEAPVVQSVTRPMATINVPVQRVAVDR